MTNMYVFQANPAVASVRGTGEQDDRLHQFRRQLENNADKITGLQEFYKTYSGSRGLLDTDDRIVFVKQLPGGELDQSGLDYVASKVEKVFARKSGPSSLKLVLKASFFLIKQSTGEVRFFSAGSNTTVATFHLKNAQDGRKIRELKVGDILDRMLQNTSAGSEWSFLAFASIEISIDMYF